MINRSWLKKLLCFIGIHWRSVGNYRSRLFATKNQTVFRVVDCCKCGYMFGNMDDIEMEREL
jgi:hypothetical protein